MHFWLPGPGAALKDQGHYFFLLSIVVFPNLDSITETFPNLTKQMQGHDVAYAAMMTYLPAGLIGIVLTMNVC